MTRKSFEGFMRAAGKAVARTTRAATPSTPAPVLLHLDDAELRALDRWIAGQPDPRPTRAEAAKRLLGAALART